MEIEKKAFASEMCHSRDGNSPNGGPPLFKKRPCHRCFPVNFCEISKSNFFAKHLWATASGLESKIE